MLDASHTATPAQPGDDTLTPYHLERVLALVRMKLPPSYDREQLAIDVLMESWLNHQPFPTVEFIHHRCIDAMRRKRLENHVMTESALAHRRGFVDPPDPKQKELLNQLTKCLDPQEKRAIALRYYCDCTVDDTAKQMNLPVDALRLLIQRALHKMREAAQ